MILHLPEYTYRFLVCLTNYIFPIYRYKTNSNKESIFKLTLFNHFICDIVPYSSRKSSASQSVSTRWLGQGHTTIREELFTQWVKFFQSLLTGPSPEEAAVARVAAANMRTTTARNNKLILDNTGLHVKVATPKQVLEEMRLRETEMTSAESHTARLLTRALEQRGFLNLNDICTKDITDTIESLCTT